MKRTKEKSIEYDDAPSGWVTMYNYKEPFMEFNEGYGYEGVLLFDSDTDKIQCHFCGEWYEALGKHLAKEHNMRAAAYKELTGLRQSTALINERTREKLIASGLEPRMANLKPGGKKSEETKEKIRQTLKRNARENQNETGTCPAQLLDRLKKLYIELGRTPTDKEITFQTTLVKVYGSTRKALKLAGIPPRKVGVNVTKKNTAWTQDRCLEWVKLFYKENERLPKATDFRNNKMYGCYQQITKLGMKNIYNKALNGDGKYRGQVKYYQYTEEELLGFMRSFEKIHGREPSPSDCRRGLLPHHSRYYDKFGSWKAAKALAFNI